MIKVIDELHLNDFKEVHCCKPRDLFARFGHCKVHDSFDSSDEPIPMNLSKIDILEDMQNYDNMMQSYERSKQESSSDLKLAEVQNEDSN